MKAQLHCRLNTRTLFMQVKLLTGDFVYAVTNSYICDWEQRACMLRTPAIVCVLRELSISKALTALRRGADAVELRLDLFKPEEREATRVKAFVEALREEEAKAGVILTNRSAAGGGKFEGSEDERLSLLKEALEASEADAVDVEYFVTSIRSNISPALSISAYPLSFSRFSLLK